MVKPQKPLTIETISHADEEQTLFYDEKKTWQGELWGIFSDKESITVMNVYTDNDELTSVIRICCLEQIILQDDRKTVVLGRKKDDAEKENPFSSIRKPGWKCNKTAKNTDESSIEKQRQMCYMSMQMEVSLDN